MENNRVPELSVAWLELQTRLEARLTRGTTGVDWETSELINRLNTFGLVLQLEIKQLRQQLDELSAKR